MNPVTVDKVFILNTITNKNNSFIFPINWNPFRRTERILSLYGLADDRVVYIPFFLLRLVVYKLIHVLKKNTVIIMKNWSVRS